MGKILNGILVVLVTIALFAVSMKAKAGTQEEFLKLLSDKKLVYVGSCNFDSAGILTFKSDQTVKARKPCAVGFEIGNTTRHYVVLYGTDGVASEMIVYDEEKKTQAVLWRRGTSV